MAVDAGRTVFPYSDGGGAVCNDLENGLSTPIVVIVARGRVELGNMGLSFASPPLGVPQ